MKRIAILAAALLLPGCSTLNEYGIGGPPGPVWRGGKAHIEEKVAGSDGVWLTLMRRFHDGDRLCAG